MQKIFIYGASGHGKVVAEIARLNGYEDIDYIDDGDNPYLTFESFLKLEDRSPVALGVGANHIREKIYEKCKDEDIEIITLIHPGATVSDSVIIGEGTVVMAGAVINPDAKIGKGCIINTSAVVEHDNHIGNFSHISPQVACAGGVKVGDLTHIGIGSCIIQGITIGRESTIGAGSVVVRDIGDRKLAYGNPCKIIKENK